MIKYRALFFFLFFFPGPVLAKDYTVFNPTPDEEMRPMNTERPSRADTVFTVDPGHFQVETSLLARGQNNDCYSSGCNKSKKTFIGNETTLRLGLTQNSDFQMQFAPYVSSNVKSPGRTEKNRGFGDLVLRYKYSFAGNYEPYGLAVIPYIKLPTSKKNGGNNDVEGGLGIPFLLMDDGIWSLGGMTQINFLKNQDSQKPYRRAYYASYANAIFLFTNWNTKLTSFIEYYTYKADRSNSWWQNTFDFGVIYTVNKNFKIDTGMNIGTTNAADDFYWFAGGAYRF